MQKKKCFIQSVLHCLLYNFPIFRAIYEYHANNNLTMNRSYDPEMKSFRHFLYNENPITALNTTPLKYPLPLTDAIDRQEKIHICIWRFKVISCKPFIEIHQVFADKKVWYFSNRVSIYEGWGVSHGNYFLARLIDHEENRCHDLIPNLSCIYKHYEDKVKSSWPSLRETWDKRLLGRDLDGSWCHRHTMSMIKLF